jgi:translation initiation factor IF-1
MKYKKGDKVVVEITEVDEKDKELTYGVGNPTWIRSKYILGKLEDFAKPKKIKFSEAEKKEFDELYKKLFLSYSSNTYQAMRVLVESNNYPELNARVAGSFDKQMELLNSLRNPSLIEVVKEKKYYIKILGQYLVRNSNGSEGIELVSKRNADTFTPDEIAEMNKWEKFKEIGLEKCKELVEDE